MNPSSAGDTAQEGGGSRRFRWDAIAVAGALLLVVLAFQPAVEALVRRWLLFDQAYSHGLFVFAASLFLVGRVLWRRRFPITPSVSGLILAGVTAFCITLAAVVNIQILQHMGIVFLWWAGVAALLGWRAALHFVIPIGFVYFAVPFWDYLTPLLVGMAVVVNDFLLGFRGIHFQVEGAYIHLLDIGTFEVDDSCSGQRYLVVALTLATLFSALNFVRVREWVLLHAAAIGLALLVNWIRIFVIILMGYETQMQTSLVDDHEFFGWVLFAAALVPFFYLANRLEARGFRATRAARDAGTNQNPAGSVVCPRPAYTVTILAGLVAVVVSPAMLLAGPADNTGEAPASIALPEVLEAWERSDDLVYHAWSPRMNGRFAETRAVYAPRADDAVEGARIRAGIWYYPRQVQGSELIQYNNHLVDRREWTVTASQPDPLSAGAGRILDLEPRFGGERQIVWYRYRVGERWTAGSLDTKAAMLAAAFQGRRDGALVALNVPCGRNVPCDEARALLLDDGAAPALFREVAEALANPAASTGQ